MAENGSILLAFDKWAQDKLDFRNFLERNADKYNRTKFDAQGQAVYIEVGTGNYWYLDNLHKNHFDVFNRQGKHLGEANLKGILDVSKNDKEKSFKL